MRTDDAMFLSGPHPANDEKRHQLYAESVGRRWLGGQYNPKCVVLVSDKILQVCTCTCVGDSTIGIYHDYTGD